MYVQRPWEKSAGSTRDSVQPPTPSATANAMDDGGELWWLDCSGGVDPTRLTKKASSPESGLFFRDFELDGSFETPRTSVMAGSKLYAFLRGWKRRPLPDEETATR